MWQSHQRRLSSSALCGACLLACGGFEPDFAPPAAPSASAGLAGFSYDAGAAPSEIGKAGRSAIAEVSGSGGTAGGAGKPPRVNETEGGEGGELSSDSPSDADSGEGGWGSALGGSGGSWASTLGGSAGSSWASTRGGASSGGGGSSLAGAGQGGGASTAGTAGSGGAPSTHGGAGSGGSESGGAGSGAGGGAAGAESGLERALIFSEYVEGSGSFKGFEIRALETSSLDGCRVAIYSNGEATNPSKLVLSGLLEAGETRSTCSANLVEELAATCDGPPLTLSSLFNGDDALVLECDGVVIDSIGQVGFDPGTAWEGTECSTLNRTLRRRCSVEHGDVVTGDAFDPSVEWACLPVDTFSGLGDAACE